MLQKDFNVKISALYKTFDTDCTGVKDILLFAACQLNDFQTSLKNGNCEDIRFKAHKIKGELGTLGFVELSALVAEIEPHLASGTYQLRQTRKFDESAKELLQNIDTWVQTAMTEKRIKS
jgi:HPt (histidine-containing phosphotransfer) domain-containing protein